MDRENPIRISIRPMIIHVFNSSIVSGPETLAMPALAQFGEPVLIVLLSEDRLPGGAEKVRRYSEGLGLRTVEIRVRSRLDARAARDLRELAIQEKAKILHAHDVKASYYAMRASYPVPPGKRWKLVSTHHGVHARSGFVVSLYEIFYVKRVLPHFDRVLTVCSSDRAILLRRGLDPSKVVVHLNGVDRPRTDPTDRSVRSAEVRKRWGLNEEGGGAWVFGVVARLSSEKRHSYILRMLREFEISNPHSNWVLLCFGSGVLERSLREESERLGLAPKVRWMGYRGGLGEEMAGFDVLFSLSKGEGLPINVIEAGWAGTPVFGTAIDGLLDLVGQAEGRLIAPSTSPAEAARALEDLIFDRQRLRELGKNFLTRVESDFSGRRWIESLKQIYSEL